MQVLLRHAGHVRVCLRFVFVRISGKISPMKKITNAVFLTLLSLIHTSAAFASGHEIGFGAVKIDPHQYGVTSFWCSAKDYVSDMPLPNFQGCESKNLAFGTQGHTAKLIIAYYDWQQLEDGSKTPKTVNFIETPDGSLYRLLDTTFLKSPQLEAAFYDILGGGKPQRVTNLRLANFGKPHLQQYGTTFCLAYQMNAPFYGVLGWCQNDRLVSGEAYYLDGVLRYNKAAIMAQNYIYEHKIPVKGTQLFHPETVSAFNLDRNGAPYWAFAIPADTPNAMVNMYGLRVYLNGYVELSEHKGNPQPEQL